MKATVSDGSRVPLDREASAVPIISPFSSKAVIDIRALLAVVPPKFRSEPRMSTLTPDFDWS